MEHEINDHDSISLTPEHIQADNTYCSINRSLTFTNINYIIDTIPKKISNPVVSYQST